jgi:general secretion pathway protein F
MPVYSYKGVNSKDKKVSGLMEAESAKAARQKLRKMEIYPIELTETVEKAEAAGRVGRLLRFGGGVPAMELAAMTRQLSTLVGASLPLVQCLNALTDQVEHARLRTVLAEVREAVNEGSSLADALANYPRIFSDLYVNMIRAGEQSGALEIVLQRLADFTEKQADLRNKVLFAMLYPVIILVIMFLVVVMMFTFVIPKITVLFEQTKQTLPPLTVAMIAISDFMKGWGGLAILALMIASAVGLRYWVKTPAGRERFDRFILKVPVLGRIARNLAVSRFAKTLSTLLMSGIALLKALDIVEKVVGNTMLANAIKNARENITEGASIADPLRASGVFPPFVIQMIASGEQSGELEFMLQKASEAFDREVENAVNGLTALIEPIMILILAGMVVVVILSFLMPILDLTSGFGG